MSNLQLLLESQSKIKAATKEIRDFVAKVVDKDSFVEKDAYLTSDSFFDGVEALGEGVLTGYATLNERPVTIIAQNSKVLGGSMSKAHAEKITKAMDFAMRNGTPIISILDSTGARIAEGVEVLEGYAQVLAAAMQAKEFLPHIAVIKGNTIGLGAIYAQSASFVFMGDDAVSSLNAPKAVIAKEGLSDKSTDLLGAKSISTDGVQTALLYKDTNDLRNKLNVILQFVSGAQIDTDDDPNRIADNLNEDYVSEDIVKALVDDKRYFEVFQDYEKDVLTAFASVNTKPIAIVATNLSGKSPKLSLGGVKKITRFLDSIRYNPLSVVFVVDCEGIETCLKSEQSCAIIAAQKLIEAVFNTQNRIAIVSGKAIGFAYTALASKGLNTQYSIAFPDAVISPVNAQIAVDILEDSKEYKDSKDPIATKQKLMDKYERDMANPFKALKSGYIDQIIVPAHVRPYVASILSSVEEI